MVIQKLVVHSKNTFTLCPLVCLSHSLSLESLPLLPFLTASDLKPPPSDMICSLTKHTSWRLQHTTGTLCSYSAWRPHPQHLVLERGLSILGRLLLLQPSCYIQFTEVLHDMQFGIDSTQLQPPITFWPVIEDSSSLEFSVTSLAKRPTIVFVSMPGRDCNHESWFGATHRELRPFYSIMQ
jgi:hypothetical protein